MCQWLPLRARLSADPVRRSTYAAIPLAWVGRMRAASTKPVRPEELRPVTSVVSPRNRPAPSIKPSSRAMRCSTWPTQPSSDRSQPTIQSDTVTCTPTSAASTAMIPISSALTLSAEQRGRRWQPSWRGVPGGRVAQAGGGAPARGACGAPPGAVRRAPAVPRGRSHAARACGAQAQIRSSSRLA